jgi:hypothetical protein
MKRIILFFLFVLSTVTAKAQFEPQWQLVFPEYEDFNITATTAFADGYVLLGSFADTIRVGGITMCSHGKHDVILLHLDTLGVVRNAISIGKEGDDRVSAFFNLNDTLYICGQTTLDGLNKFFIYSYDVSFNQLSDLTFPFEGKLQMDLLKVEHDKLLLGGSMKGTVTIGSQSVINKSDEHAFFIELSQEGELVSSWLTFGSGLHRLYSFVHKGNGDYVLMLNAGKGTLDMPDTPSLAFKGNGVVVANYDSGWNNKKCSVFDCTGFVEATDLVDNGQGCVIGLNYNGTLILGEQTFSSPGSFSSLLIQFDLEGRPIWYSEIGSDDYCRLLNVETNDETIVCTGYHYGKLMVEDEVLEETIDRNTFLVAFDNEGRFSWHIDIEGIDADMGRSLVYDHNSVMLNGICQSATTKNTSGIATVNNKNSTFAHKYILKTDNEKDITDEDSSIKENDNLSDITNQANNSILEDNLLIDVFPNPVKNVLHWSTNQPSDWMLELFDAKGVLLTQKCYNNRQEGYLDLSSCPAGLYIIRISSSEKQGHRVIIKN